MYVLKSYILYALEIFFLRSSKILKIEGSSLAGVRIIFKKLRTKPEKVFFLMMSDQKEDI